VDVITTQSLAKYTFTDLDAGHKYYVTIVVWNDADLSTASNPYAVSTDELPVYKTPLFLMVVISIVVAILFVVLFDRFIRRQRASTAAAAEEGATAAVTSGPEEAGLEIEAIEEDTVARPARPGRRGEVADDAVQFMRQMQGDEEI
jgi:hypothetical protein